MKKILIYAGTTEGRTLAELLAEAGIYCEVCVATDYGEQVMEESPHIHVRMGRLTMEDMKKLYLSEDYAAVVDATHPFATVVTENIERSLRDCRIPLLRLARTVEYEKEENCRLFPSAEECSIALREIEGNILLTTGSKELCSFCESGLRERLIVRVLPGKESLELCYKNGLEGKQIIAMQGPFSKEMNLAIIHQYHVACLVTKESGKTGGTNEKAAAAKEAGIPCYMIQKPEIHTSSKENSMLEICEELQRLTGRQILRQEKCRLSVVLAGIGMGTLKSMTQEVKERIDKSDYLFGAKRMIDAFMPRIEKYPYYLESDIIPCLEKIKRKHSGEISVTVLFSGDTGFYSGSEKLYRSLCTLEDASVSVLPGISTISALAAKLGVSWQNAEIVSAHGTEEMKWCSRLSEAVQTVEKTFFLTSGYRDVQLIGKVLDTLNTEGMMIYLGYQISYPEEKISILTPKQCENVIDEGLYAGMIINPDISPKRLTPGWGDEIFLRDKVPMTKEEVREISICKLGLTKDSVVYDIGSGTGSVGIEISALSREIKVYAIETNPVAIQLLRKNLAAFCIHNMQVVEACAPEGMEMLPAPTHAFIGGSKGRLKKILDELYRKNSRMRIVINAVSLETLCEVQDVLRIYPMENVETIQVSVSKAKEQGKYHLMQANNPVYIFSFNFKEKDKWEIQE